MAADHRHPGDFCTRGDQLAHHCIANRISGAAEAVRPLIYQEILFQQTAEFVGQLKGLINFRSSSSLKARSAASERALS